MKLKIKKIITAPKPMSEEEIQEMQRQTGILQELPRDFVRKLIEKQQKEEGKSMKPILYFDMDGVLVDFESALKKQAPETLKRYEGHPDDIPGLFSQMEPMEGAIEAVHKLAEKYDCYILSTAPWNNPSSWADKVQWVTDHLDDVFHKKIILTHHKNLLDDGKAILIDDRTKHGAETFGDQLIHFGTEQFPDWQAVLKHLL